MTKYILSLFILILAGHSSVAQVEHRNIGFSKPMHLSFNLAGSFGEPRPDHFHSGIDIKTNGVEGEPVFSIYDGYISRIRVSPYGYGKAIYITHPNGYTSVYGHLSAFNVAIEKYVHEQHYKTQQSELDLTLNAAVFPVKQNDTIAFSGNTGGSTAPHLHFEIRDSKTEHALNALDFYPKEFYVDTIPPQLNKVKISQFSGNFYTWIPGKTSKIFRLKKQDDHYVTDEPILIDNFDHFCFSLEGFDKQDQSENKNGINKIEVFQKDSLVFRYDLAEIDFDKTRMCNAFVDYTEMMNDSGYFYNCYRLKNNLLSIYTSGNNGIFKMNRNDTAYHLDIYCYDYGDNKTHIKLNIINSNSYVDWEVSGKSDSSIYKIFFIKSQSMDTLQLRNFNITFPENSFYDDMYLSLVKSFQNKNIESYSIFNNADLIPLQKPGKIQFTSAKNKYSEKTVIVKQDNKGKETALKTTFDKTKFYADTKELGTFYLKHDTTAPVVKLLNYQKADSIFAGKKIQVEMTDNLSGIAAYNGYIDGHWVNFYYDAKNDLIEYRFDEYCTAGEHTLKIVVTDQKANQTIVSQKFKR